MESLLKSLYSNILLLTLPKEAHFGVETVQRDKSLFYRNVLILKQGQCKMKSKKELRVL